MEAGPSVPRKPAARHPSAPTSRKRKIPPPLPAPPTVSSHPSASVHPKGVATTLPIKPLQGVSRRSQSSKDGFRREVIFVTRKTGLGALMGRCRSLVVDEGYTSLRFHAIGAAIPQALLLLHALLDLLPYPVGEKGMWHELRTGSVECVDEEIGTGPSSAGKNMDGDDLAWLEGAGAIEADVPEKRSRIKSTLQIDLHISPRPKVKIALEPAKTQAQAGSTGTTSNGAKKTRNRPSKKRRVQLAQQRHAGDIGRSEEDMMNVDGDGGEEDMMNDSPVIRQDEEEEEEQVEGR
ncbi:hypothetical protein IAU60_006463 [Kwoniella sp. DSM 27419]